MSFIFISKSLFATWRPRLPRRLAAIPRPWNASVETHFYIKRGRPLHKAQIRVRRFGSEPFRAVRMMPQARVCSL
jgi:hypothetical protein